jgi:hypothetical protein
MHCGYIWNEVGIVDWIEFVVQLLAAAAQILEALKNGNADTTVASDGIRTALLAVSKTHDTIEAGKKAEKEAGEQKS